MKNYRFPLIPSFPGWTYTLSSKLDFQNLNILRTIYTVSTLKLGTKKINFFKPFLRKKKTQKSEKTKSVKCTGMVF